MSKRASNDDTLLTDAIRRVRAGEVSAFEAVVRHFERPLRMWLAGQAPPGVDVDEIAQRSFVAAFTRLAEFEVGTDLSAWLFTIARFQLKTEVTRLRRVADYHTRYAPDLVLRELERHGAEPLERQQARIDHLRDCLGKLGEPLRRFFSWRYVEEIPLDEMAARSDRSVPAVKKQLWKLRRQLQDCIEERMAAEEGSS